MAVKTRKTAAVVLDAPRDDFDGHGSSAGDMAAENAGVKIRAQRVHVMNHQIAQTGPALKHCLENTVAKKVGNLIPVAHGMETL